MDLQKFGDRWVLATEMGAFSLEKDKLTRIMEGPASIACVNNVLWMSGRDPMTGFQLAYLRPAGGELRWLGWPEGVTVPEDAQILRGTDGTLSFCSAAGMSKASPEEQQRLVDAPPHNPEALRCRLFARVAGPILSPTGDSYLFLAAHPSVLFRLSGGVLTTWSPEPDDVYFHEGAWAVADDTGRIWILTLPDSKGEQKYQLYDPATGQTQGGPSLKAALENPTLCPRYFFAGKGEYRVPVLGRDGLAAVLAERTLQCRVKGAWLPEAYNFGYFSKNPTLTGAGYVDEKGRLCVEALDGVFTLTPGETTFQPAPEAPHRYARTATVPKPGRHTAQTSSQTKDPLGITWRLKEGALLREGYGLSAVVVSTSEPTPFRDWKTLACIALDNAGGVFLRKEYGTVADTVHIRNAFRPLKTSVTAAPEPAGMVRIQFADTLGLSHAWRVDQAPWRDTAEKELLAGPYAPGGHAIEAYAFDKELNLDPTPERIPVKIAGAESSESVIDALLHGTNEQKKWALDVFKNNPEQGASAVKQALKGTLDDHARWVLEATLQQLEIPPTDQKKPSVNGEAGTQ